MSPVSERHIITSHHHHTAPVWSQQSTLNRRIGYKMHIEQFVCTFYLMSAHYFPIHFISPKQSAHIIFNDIPHILISWRHFPYMHNKVLLLQDLNSRGGKMRLKKNTKTEPNAQLTNMTTSHGITMDDLAGKMVLVHWGRILLTMEE